tara:strand:+ start:224 stop:856 length:633 start_codon:yes stop_codon:yes gene_type:complete
MGINSQGVSYDFGQMGVAFVNGTDSFHPPTGMVIVAITAVGGTTDVTFADTVGLISELDANGNSPWFTTAADAHGTGISAAQDAHNDNGSNATGVITLTSADANIKVGMIVEQSTMCPRSLTNPYVVKSISGTTLTVAKKLTPTITAAVAGNLASGGAAIHFFENNGGQGFGGKQVAASSSLALADGTTVYGRWTGGKLAGGAVIVYFGF